MRYVISIGLVLALVVALVGIKFKQISSLIHMGEEMQKAGPPPEVVASATSKEDTWDGTLTSVGSVAAAKGVNVSTEVPGVVAAIRFESGATVKQGDVLVELDSRVERAQLASIIARRDLATVTADRSRSLVASKAIPAAQLDNDEAQLKSAKADLGALQAQIDRKVVRAPFAGRLGIRAVNVGQYLGPGTIITVLESMDSVYVDFSLPQQRSGDVKVGTKVTISITGAKEDKGPKDAGPPQDATFEGLVAAIEPNVDPTTRTIKLRASVPNREDKLRAGMFATVVVALPQHGGTVVTVPATAVVHASFGDSVFIIEPKKDAAAGADGQIPKVARQQFVRVGEGRGDFFAITDGLKAGQEVVVAGAFKLKNGSSVIVNNSIKLDPQMAPQLENH